MSEQSIAEYQAASLRIACRQAKRIRDALFAACDDCGTVINYNGLWSLSKSVYLHTSSTGHRVRYYEPVP